MHESSEEFLAAVLEKLRSEFPAKLATMSFAKLGHTLRKRINNRFGKLLREAKEWANQKRLADPGFEQITALTVEDVMSVRKGFGLNREHILSAEHVRSWIVRVYHFLESENDISPNLAHLRFPNQSEIPHRIYTQMPAKGKSFLDVLYDRHFIFLFSIAQQIMQLDVQRMLPQGYALQTPQ